MCLYLHLTKNGVIYGLLSHIQGWKSWFSWGEVRATFFSSANFRHYFGAAFVGIATHFHRHRTHNGGGRFEFRDVARAQLDCFCRHWHGWNKCSILGLSVQAHRHCFRESVDISFLDHPAKGWTRIFDNRLGWEKLIPCSCTKGRCRFEYHEFFCVCFSKFESLYLIKGSIIFF